jgi:hypothetical protein
LKATYYKTVTGLCIFFVSVFTVAFIFNPHYPMFVIAGESSVGTWMSGVLLVISGTTVSIVGMRQGWFPWLPLSAFFMLLALDERFMFHERWKQRIIFSAHDKNVSRWVYELPVMAGACAGALVAFVLWRYLRGGSRVLLLCASVLGAASVAVDVLAAGVLWEECLKLLAELLMVCALLSRIEE